MNTEAPRAVTPASDRKGGAVRIFLCGDVMVGRGVDQVLPWPGDPRLQEPYVRSALDYVRLAERANGPIHAPVDVSYIWGAALAEWRQMAPDFGLANLETAITRSGHYAPKGINYRMTPENAACLAAANFDACTLANNHVLDFGSAGLIDTLEALQGLGLEAVGSGPTLAAAGGPITFAVPQGTTRVVVVAAAFEDSGAPSSWRAGPRTPGINLVEPTEAAAKALACRLQEARRPGDIGVVSIHWGSNWGYQPSLAHRRFAHALIDTGQVSIVHGHSSHHPRPIEIYRDRLILYGCGDFMNDYEGIGGYEAYRGDIVAMYFADVLPGTGVLDALAITPLRIRRMQLTRASPDEAAWLANVLTRESKPFDVQLAPAPNGRLTAVHGRGLGNDGRGHEKA